MAARHTGSAALLTGGRGCTDRIVIGGAPSMSITPSIGVPVGVIGSRDSSPPPPAPRSGSRIRTGNCSVSKRRIWRGRSSCTLNTSTSCSRATRTTARGSACPSHRLLVITTSRGPSASGCGPARARGTIASPSATAAAAATRATARRLSASAATTGTGEVSAAYGVNAISATSG